MTTIVSIGWESPPGPPGVTGSGSLTGSEGVGNTMMVSRLDGEAVCPQPIHVVTGRIRVLTGCWLEVSVSSWLLTGQGPLSISCHVDMGFPIGSWFLLEETKKPERVTKTECLTFL